MGGAGARAWHQTVSAGRNRGGGAGARRARVAGAVLSHGRDFSQRKSIDRRVHFAKSSLELRNRKIDLSKTGIVNIDNCKAEMIFGKPANLLKIIQLIGSDSEKAVICERTMD